MKIYLVRLNDIVRYLIIFLIAVSAAVGSRDYIAEVAQITKRELPIYSVQREDKKIALTFDSAWDNKDLPLILETLSKHNARATFFVTGGWVDRYPDSLKAIYEDGHEIGNHSDKHPHIARMNKEQVKDEIMNCHHKVQEILGYDMTSFRPPYGEYNNRVIQTTKELGYNPIQWDVDSFDWMNKGVQPLLDKVLNHKKLSGGSIILMHTGAQYTAETLDTLITGLEAKGYTFERVSNLIYKDNYMINHEGKQIKTVETKNNNN